MRIIALSTTLFLAMGVLTAQERRADDRPFDDATFVATAGSSGLHEVELAKLAMAQAKNEAVKKFAETLHTDHMKANEELKKAATDAGLKVPDKMNPEHQKVVDTFKDYKGDNFDSDFMRHMISGHEKSAELFKRASKEAKDQKLKDFAAKTLPVIQAHLDEATKIEVK
jgi:putative membrane protein